MKLLVGLGNPGRDYARHRHNIGFMAVDRIADDHGFSPERSKFRGLIREGSIKGPDGVVKTLILKPGTFMNESGRAVAEASRFYKIDLSDIFVFHDELDLAPGKCRIKIGGGAAGHNGLRSMDAQVGNEFVRVRLGIGHPGRKEAVHGHVLGNFAKADEAWLDALLRAVSAQIGNLVADAPKDRERFQSLVAHDIGEALGLNRPSTGTKKPKTGKTDKAEAKPVTAAAPSKASTEQAPSSSPFRDALSSLLSGKRDKN